MFDDEDHKRAIKDFIAYLRTITTQKNLAFFSDVSREYVKYLEILQSQHLAQVAEKGVALNYIHKTKRAKSL